ncbi:LOW QUALITY PROTEIN: salivary peroxidase/catechol oxidase [Procambarus clarkii]|uniref:LOW QUALITY PROTEIN: salivary peroxidase/catechol oxidase n=1 Tax=Procambarus clarkii TaxID=6728 RepID=UPI003741F38B
MLLVMVLALVAGCGGVPPILRRKLVTATIHPEEPKLVEHEIEEVNEVGPTDGLRRNTRQISGGVVQPRGYLLSSEEGPYYSPNTPTALPVLRPVASSPSLAALEKSRHPASLQDSEVSPYWADPEGREPSTAPYTTPSHFIAEPNQCRRVESSCSRSYGYRSITGYCNNLLTPEFGSSRQPMPRILPPVYDVAYMRTRSVSGGLLPSPRMVTLGLRNAPRKRSHSHPVLLMQIGQLIDHDLVVNHRVPVNGADCGDCSSWRFPACAPITLPPDDAFLTTFDRTGKRRCLQFIRSAGVWQPDGTGRFTLQQLNFNTAFLDLSSVYGSTACRQEQLRLNSAGRLRETPRGLLPLAPAEMFEDCRMPQGKCFLGGDDRSNEHLLLLVIHSLFLREHNRLATRLNRINSHWDDERLYQEARRINIAQFQNIVYKEFLPVLIGRRRMEEYKLPPRSSGYYQDYDVKVNPGVMNEFATAAFRMGHTMIPDDVMLLDGRYGPVGSIPLVQTFQNPSAVLGEGKFEELLRGLIGTRVNGVDMAIVDSVTNRLFERVGVPSSGQDLLALNIARGRDHGIAPYHAYASACGRDKMATFEDLKTLLHRNNLDVLKSIYSSIQDVDLIVGGLAEESLPGALLGPTLSCIIAYQFLNLKRGDRFWYENADSRLSHDQLQSIRQSSLARVVCDNLDDRAAVVPRRIFDIYDEINVPLPCHRLPGTNIELWTEDPYQKAKECAFEEKLYPAGRLVPVSPCMYCVCQPSGKLWCQTRLDGCRGWSDEYCNRYCDGRQEWSGFLT